MGKVYHQSKERRPITSAHGDDSGLGLKTQCYPPSPSPPSPASLRLHLPQKHNPQIPQLANSGQVLINQLKLGLGSPYKVIRSTL